MKDSFTIHMASGALLDSIAEMYDFRVRYLGETCYDYRESLIGFMAEEHNNLIKNSSDRTLDQLAKLKTVRSKRDDETWREYKEYLVNLNPKSEEEL